MGRVVEDARRAAGLGDDAAPTDVLPDADPAIVAHVAGFFAARAGLPPIPAAPRVREGQRQQLEVALPWAAAVLGLPSPEAR